MYRFLIIDDEPVVREGISRTIDWNAHGFELVGACRDGREGLQAVAELRPDVVLTDICMPFVDGMELAATIGEQYPLVKTILLTGHDEFEYAQEAVKLKVRDFLLKPITANELRAMLDSLRGEMDRERDHRARLERLDDQVRASLPVYRERFLNRLVRTSLDNVELDRSMGLLDLDLPGPRYCAVIADLDPPAVPEQPGALDVTDQRILTLALQELVTRCIPPEKGMVAFSAPGEETVIIVSVEDAIAPALWLAETVSERIQQELGRTISIGIGMVVEHLEEVHQSFRAARTALEQRLILGGNQIITIQQAHGEAPTGVSATPPEPYERLIERIKTGADSDLELTVRSALESMRTEPVLDRSVVMMHRLLADVIGALESVGVAYHEVPAFGSNPFEKLSRIKTIDEMERWILRCGEDARHLMEQRRRRHSHRKALAAVEYVNAHFQDSGISLQEVCSALAVSKSYLSPIFKAHTGMTFVEYLTDRRTDRARELLGEGRLKIYEIASEVGFRDAHYFSLIFKKQTGKTPREYQETVHHGRS